MPKICADCKFWQSLDHNDDTYSSDRNYRDVGGGADGICRRLPPFGMRRDAPAVSGADYGADASGWAQWPVTDGELDWCGEHRLRDEEAANA